VKTNKEIWVTNLTSKDLLIDDLNVRLRARSSVNLLVKNLRLTEELVVKSINNGSINKKSKFIAVRKEAPVFISKKIEASKDPLLKPKHSIIEHIDENYQELDIIDDPINQSDEL